MNFRLLILFPLLLAWVLVQGCTSVGDKFDEISRPRLPSQIYARAATLTPQHFAPWIPPNPFDYEGKYFGESGAAAERLEIEIFGQGDGIMITGTRRVTTTGHSPVTTPIAPAKFNLEFEPQFATSGQNGFFVTLIDPSGGPSAEPVPGIVLGSLFLAKAEPPPGE